MRNGHVGYWFEDAELRRSRPRLEADTEADVVFVGAGFSGLWSAYYLSQLDPQLKIVIVEAEFVGFGASGRNAGHLMSNLPGMRRLYLKEHSPDKVDDFAREMRDSIDEIVRVASLEGINADIVKGGTTAIARNAAQMRRLEHKAKSLREAPWAPERIELLSARELRSHITMDGAIGGLWVDDSARVQPAKLAKGLARAVEKRGVTIYEGTKAAEISPGALRTAGGQTVRARHIVIATEGFTAELKGHHRTWLPKLSSQIITEPIDEETINELWPSSTMANDNAHMFCYLHKTADNRIAIGGPGVPYYWGSRIDDRGTTEQASIRVLKRKLTEFFPALSNINITHTWTGVLGVPRDWSATVSLNEETGIGMIGGYVGSGVTGTNLAGRTIAEMITGEYSKLSTLPWVNKSIRKWESEPLRWIALRGLYKAYVVADFIEDRAHGGRTSLVARAANIISGRY